MPHFSFFPCITVYISLYISLYQALRGGEWDANPERMLASTPTGRPFDCSFCVDAARLREAMSRTAPNTESVGSLFHGFFNRYAKEFDFHKMVVSPRCGVGRVERC